jgi:hypothetical protein
VTDPPPLAWIAGVIDARGHIEAHNRHGHVQPRVRITTRHTPLLETLARFCGNKVVLDDRGYSRRPCGDHCTQAHSHIVRQSKQWTVDSARATVVLYNVVPFMYAQKTEAPLALEAGLNRYPPARGDLPAQMVALGWSLPEPGRALGSAT